MSKYTVYYQSPDDTIGDVDITAGVISIDRFDDCGTGQIPEGDIMLKANYGYFLTNQKYVEVKPTRPKLPEWSRLKIVLEGESLSYSKIMVVDNKDVQRGPQGRLIVVKAFGREIYLQEHRMLGHFIPSIRVYDMIVEIIKRYNAERGSEEPEIIYDVDSDGTDWDIPQTIVDSFDWGESGTNMYQALMDCLASLSRPGPAGGQGDFYELNFADDPTDDAKIICKIFPQGFTAGTIPIKEASNTMNFLPNLPRKDANLVVVRGAPDKGRLPVNLALYKALIDNYQNFPEWQPGIPYSINTYIRWHNLVFKSALPVPKDTLPNTPLYWTSITIQDYIGNLNYSPWTHSKEALWRNAGSNPDGSFNVDADSVGFFDGNLVVRDTIRRDWADFRIRQESDIDLDYLYGTSSDALEDCLYEGLRILIDPSLGTLVAPFDGNDKYDTPYANAIAQYDRYGDWVVILAAEENDQCVITSTGHVWEYDRKYDPDPRNRRTGPESDVQWRDISGAYLGRDCVHHPTSIERVEGLTRAIPSGHNGNINYNSNSGIKITYAVAAPTMEIDNFLVELVKLALGPIFSGTLSSAFSYLTTIASYNWGWWANFAVPFPLCDKGGIGEDVGQLFGGTKDSKVPLLDAYNQNRTYDGKEGYNSDTANSLDRLTGITFYFKFSVQVGTYLFPLTGDLPFSIIMYDAESNVVRATFNYRFLDETQRITIPFSAFQIYRARTPIGLNLSTFVANTILPELNVQEEFQFNKIKRIVIQFDDGYDSAQRYNPANLENFLKLLGASLIGQQISMSGTIDAFGFIKAPLAIAKTGTDTRIIQDEVIDYPNVSNVEQLQAVADAELDLAQHARETYNFTEPGKLDLVPGQSVYVHDPDVIESAEDGDNTRKLIVDRITYSTTGEGITGGFVRSLHLARRINAV